MLMIVAAGALVGGVARIAVGVAVVVVPAGMALVAEELAAAAAAAGEVGSDLAADSAAASSEVDLVVGKVDFAMLWLVVRGLEGALGADVSVARRSFEFVEGVVGRRCFRHSRSLHFRHLIHSKVGLGVGKRRIVEHADWRLGVAIEVMQVDGKVC